MHVQACVQPYPGVDPDRLRAAIVKALDDFLDPLRGGPEGCGWPFGRDVYRSEVLQVIDGVQGVDCVSELALRGDGAELDSSGAASSLGQFIRAG